jgi:hemerythrin
MNAHPEYVNAAEIIDGEHALLKQFSDTLDTLLPCPADKPDCSLCTRNPPDTCREKFEGYFEHLLTFMQDHFRNEDARMRQLEEDHAFLHEAFESHREAHADLIETLVQTIAENICPARGRQSLTRMFESWLQDHLHRHDMLLLDSLRAAKLS